jgi:hydrogenase 3 maturation protease
MTAARPTTALEQEIRRRLIGRVVVVGVGNPLRGDDAAGCAIAHGLRGLPGVTVVEAEDLPEREVLRIADAAPETVVLVDAVDLGAPPGSVAVLDPDELAAYAPTTHRVPLSLLADVIRRACRARVFVLAIQPWHLTFGVPFSREVAESVEVVIGLLRRVLTPASRGTEAVAC